MYKYVIGIILFALSIASCATRKEITYFQTGELANKETTNKSFTPVFKVDDLLSIVVTAEDPESVIPFNLPPALGQEPFNFGYYTGTPVFRGYLIDQHGDIELPILGKIHVAGKNRVELIAELTEQYKKYLKSPVVNIQIRNFKVTVLGDVRKPGTFHVPNERLTLLEAIGLAGDLHMTGLRKNVLVIRDREGVKTEFRLDLTSSDFLDSPAYYLEQNDVVYVEPNITSRSQAAFWRTTGGLFISMTSLIITTIVLITN